MQQPSSSEHIDVFARIKIVFEEKVPVKVGDDAQHCGALAVRAIAENAVSLMRAKSIKGEWDLRGSFVENAWGVEQISLQGPSLSMDIAVLQWVGKRPPLVDATMLGFMQYRGRRYPIYRAMDVPSPKEGRAPQRTSLVFVPPGE